MKMATVAHYPAHPDTSVVIRNGQWYLAIWPGYYDGRILPLMPKKNEELFKFREWYATRRT